jgi:hypothetical protein
MEGRLAIFKRSRQLAARATRKDADKRQGISPKRNFFADRVSIASISTSFQKRTFPARQTAEKGSKIGYRQQLKMETSTAAPTLFSLKHPQMFFNMFYSFKYHIVNNLQALPNLQIWCLSTRLLS